MRFSGWTNERLLSSLRAHRNVAARFAAAIGCHKSTVWIELKRRGIRLSELPKYGSAIGERELSLALAEGGGVRAASLLLKTSTETVAALAEKLEIALPSTHGRAGQRCLGGLSTEELRRVLVAHRWNLAACGRALGYSRTTIRTVARERGIEVPTRRPSEFTEKAMPLKRVLEDLYEKQGLGCVRMARKLGVHQNTVLKWLRACEIPLRERKDVSCRGPVRV